MDEQRLRVVEVSGALLVLIVNVVAVVLAAGATFAARDAALASRDQVAVARDERYSDAITGLGVPEATRLASIRELETLAKTASAERKFEVSLVITTYLRSRSGEVRSSTDDPEKRVPEDMQQALISLTAIRGSIGSDARAQLPLLDLSGLNLRGVPTVTENADLSRIDFSGSSLGVSDLDSSNLSESVLTETDLAGASLQNVKFDNATLDDADLRCVNLSGADLTGVRGIETANLEGIVYDERTAWPPGFRPEKPSLEAFERLGCFLNLI